MMDELVNILASRYNYQVVRSELPLGRSNETGSHAKRTTLTHIR